MRLAAVALITLIPISARAEAPIIGGTDAPLGKWPDVAAVYTSDNLQECTGTLIAPTVVLTAGHCVIDLGGLTVSKVLIGTNSLARPLDGESIDVARAIEYPDSQGTFDVAALVLAKPATRAPRAIATGWASLEIKNDIDASIVGYGAIDKNAMMYVNELKEATTKITDADCTRQTANGCVPAAMPAGELGAGGVGMPDTCPGDSGGPLYVASDFGTFLAGVTSRGYDNNVYDCSEGGIYVRPDKVVDWLEQATGVDISRGPEPTVPAMLSAVRGHLAEAKIDHNDPKSEKHTFAITKQPKYGEAAVRDDGSLRVCAGNAVAKDSVELSITDKADATRTLTYKIALDFTDGEAGDCDVNDFDSGGCCDSGRSAGGSLPLGIGVLLVLRKRRR
jgi:secreted trypsin-like serine protease